MANPATVDTVRPFDLADALSDLHIYLQPIVDLATGVPLAFEALARFGSLSDVPVEAVFAAGHEAGQGHELEAACLRAALRHRDALPDRARLAVNISPDVLTHPSVRRAWPADLDGVIIEVTENHAGRPGAVHRELAGLRLRGAQVAVDDADTGYAGLLRLATMNPDFVKLDRSVVTGVSRNAAQAAVLETLVTFSHRTNSVVIAEGVEALTDLTLLAGFDVDYVQGYAIGRPGAVATPIGPAGRRGLPAQPLPGAAAARLPRRGPTSGAGTADRDLHHGHRDRAVRAARRPRAGQRRAGHRLHRRLGRRPRRRHAARDLFQRRSVWTPRPTTSPTTRRPARCSTPGASSRCSLPTRAPTRRKPGSCAPTDAPAC